MSFCVGEALEQSELVRGAEQAVPAGERVPALLLQGLAGSLHSPAPSPGADKWHQAPCQAQHPGRAAEEAPHATLGRAEMLVC